MINIVDVSIVNFIERFSSLATICVFPNKYYLISFFRLADSIFFDWFVPQANASLFVSTVDSSNRKGVLLMKEGDFRILWLSYLRYSNARQWDVFNYLYVLNDYDKG